MDKTQLRAFRSALLEQDVALASTDPRYVPGLHGADDEDVINALTEQILDLGATGSHILFFTGQRGTGKSTELRRLQLQLQAEDSQVILFNSLDYISETEKITVERLLLLVTAGLAEWAWNEYKEDFLNDGAWTRFKTWLQTEVKIDKINLGVKGASLGLSLQEARSTVAQHLENLAQPQQWLRQVREYAGEIIEFVRQRSRRQRIVLLVDSLERLRGVTGEDQDSVFTHVVNTFTGDFARLHIPGATVVYSTPPYLALLADVRSYVPCYSLASVRVYGKPVEDGNHLPSRRQPRPDGLAKMRSLIERRFADWKAVLSTDTLDELALASGGDLRHFMLRLVSGVARQAQFALDRLPLQKNDPIVIRTIDENRGETERLTVQSEWPLLADVAHTHNAIATDRGESLRALARLFETRVILNYRNGAEWFDVHPLLWRLVEQLEAKRKAADASTSATTPANAPNPA